MSGNLRKIRFEIRYRLKKTKFQNFIYIFIYRYLNWLFYDYFMNPIKINYNSFFFVDVAVIPSSPDKNIGWQNCWIHQTIITTRVSLLNIKLQGIIKNSKNIEQTLPQQSMMLITSWWFKKHSPSSMPPLLNINVSIYYNTLSK